MKIKRFEIRDEHGRTVVGRRKHNTKRFKGYEMQYKNRAGKVEDSFFIIIEKKDNTENEYLVVGHHTNKSVLPDEEIEGQVIKDLKEAIRK